MKTRMVAHGFYVQDLSPREILVLSELLNATFMEFKGSYEVQAPDNRIFITMPEDLGPKISSMVEWLLNFDHILGEATKVVQHIGSEIDQCRPRPKA